MNARASFARNPGQHEVRPLVVERQQLFLVRGEPEEPVPLLDPLRLDVVLGALPVDELVLRLEGLAADAVQACVDVLVDVVAAVVADPLQELLDELLVPVVRRPDEEVVCDVEAGGERPPRPRRSGPTYSCGSSPCSAATRATFDACSSTPVRRNVSRPRCRWWRVKMSAATVVYACPMCGVEFT